MASLGLVILEVRTKVVAMKFELTAVVDGVTKTWLASNIDPVFGFSSLVRFSWSTATKILDEKTRGCKWCASRLIGEIALKLMLLQA